MLVISLQNLWNTVQKINVTDFCQSLRVKHQPRKRRAGLLDHHLHSPSNTADSLKNKVQPKTE